MTQADRLLALVGVTKAYHALRPLRTQRLELHAGEPLALLGMDAAMAEVLVSLITGAQLPDEGEVHVFGRSTRSVAGVDEWVSDLDRFGLISSRAVLVDRFTAEQNLALPLSLEIDDMPPALRAEVHALASEVGLTTDELIRPTAELTTMAQLRLRVGRALALRPHVLLAEHPNASLSRQETLRFAADFARIVAGRGLASLVMTVDANFASQIAPKVLEFHAATGALTKTSTLRRWFS